MPVSSPGQVIDDACAARARSTRLEAVFDRGRPGKLARVRKAGVLTANPVAEILECAAFSRAGERQVDALAVDAFRFPYLPFQLTTREFFDLARERLEPGGTLMLNVGRKGESREVVDAVARTLAASFSHVSGVDVPRTTNSILVAAEHPLAASAGVAALGLPRRDFSMLSALPPLHAWSQVTTAPVLTDDDAPVEALTDRIVLRELWRMFTGS